MTIGFVCTWFQVFNVPVYWPVLVVYWIILFALTSECSLKEESFEGVGARYESISQSSDGHLDTDKTSCM